MHLLGRISDDDLLTWYRVADLAVTPTLALEGFGLSTAEAMSCGTPVVVTPVGANPEVVSGLGSEFVAASTSPHDIAMAVNRALGDPARLHRRPRSGPRPHSPQAELGSRRRLLLGRIPRVPRRS